MSLGKATSTWFRDSFAFLGRATRAEFCWISAFSVLAAAILAIVFSGADKSQFQIAGMVPVMLMFAAATLIIWLRRPSQPGPNTYGPNSHEVTP